MSKKILSVMLALVLVLSTLGTVAFAAGIAYEDDDSEYSQTWELGTPVDNKNGTWSVDVYLTTDYPTGAIQFVVEETDKNDVIELTNVIKGDALYYDAIITPDAESGKVLIVPAADPDNSMVDAKAIDGVIATLVYSYTGEGSAKIAILEDPKYADYKEGTLMALRAVDANLASTNLMAGQLVNGVGDEQTIGTAAEPADLAKKATAEEGILIDTAHTFGGAYKGVVFGFTQTRPNTFTNSTYLTTAFEATNDGSLEFSRSIGSSGFGTGTVITVKNSDGSESCKYVVVIFADVDGNGLTNTNDASTTKKAAVTATTFANNSVQRMAANCQLVNAAALMHTLNTNDSSAVKAHANGKKVDQAALAAKMSTLTANYK